MADKISIDDPNRLILEYLQQYIRAKQTESQANSTFCLSSIFRVSANFLHCSKPPKLFKRRTADENLSDPLPSVLLSKGEQTARCTFYMPCDWKNVQNGKPYSVFLPMFGPLQRGAGTAPSSLSSSDRPRSGLMTTKRRLNHLLCSGLPSTQGVDDVVNVPG